MCCHTQTEIFAKKSLVQGSQTMQILHPDATDGETQVETGARMYTVTDNLVSNKVSNCKKGTAGQKAFRKEGTHSNSWKKIYR